MPASDALLHSTAALLLITLAWQLPGVQRIMRTSGLGFAALGALLPLLDPLLFSASSEDQIAFLTQDPLFSGPLPGLAAVMLMTGGALLLGAPAGRCVRWAGWTTIGLLLVVDLAALTPGGAPWLAPFRSHRFSVPLLPQGHLWLIAVSAGGLIVLELGPRWKALHLERSVRRRRVLIGVAALLGTLVLSGAFAWMGLMVPPKRSLLTQISKPGPLKSAGKPDVVAQPDVVTQPELGRDLELDPVWPGRWLDIEVEGDDYVSVSKGLGSAGDEPSRFPRWNDQPALLRLLDDPTIRRMYFEVFRHPVVRTEMSGSKITLTMRELTDAQVDAAGPVLRVETDDRGRLRHYRVERLD